MKLEYKNIFSVKAVIIIIVCIFIFCLGGNRYLKINHPDLFTFDVNETVGEEGYGELKQTKDGLYNYRVDFAHDTVMIIHYNGAMINQVKEVIVPENIDGHLVTVVDEMAFSWNEYVEKIFFPDSITELRRGVVCNCPNLKQIMCGGNVSIIAKGAFEGFTGTLYTTKGNKLWEYAEKEGIPLKHYEEKQ